MSCASYLLFTFHESAVFKYVADGSAPEQRLVTGAECLYFGLDMHHRSSEAAEQPLPNARGSALLVAASSK